MMRRFAVLQASARRRTVEFLLGWKGPWADSWRLPWLTFGTDRFRRPALGSMLLKKSAACRHCPSAAAPERPWH